MKRRTFFSRIAGLIAAVAIAPEIAFRAKLPMPAAEPLAEPLCLEDFFQINYDIKRAREKIGESERLTFYTTRSEWPAIKRAFPDATIEA